jgi:ER membrane protein complex subunit 1
MIWETNFQTSTLSNPRLHVLVCVGKMSHHLTNQIIFW